MNRWALVLLSLCAICRAADSVQITAQLDVVQLSQVEAMRVIPLLEDPAASVAALQDLARESYLGRDGGPSIVYTLVTRALEGQKAVAKAAEEPQWPVEYEQEDSLAYSPTTAGKSQEPSGYPIDYFESRWSNGVMLTIGTERPAEKAGNIRLSAEIEVSTFEEWTFFEAGVLPNGRILRVQLPIIRCRHVASAAIARTGVPILVGSFKLPGAKSRFELHVLTATAKPLRGISEAALKRNEPLETGSPDPARKPPFPSRDYRGELFVFSVPAERALSLRSKLGDAGAAAEMLKQLLANLPQNPDALIDRISLPATPGNRGLAKGGTEVRYAVETPQPHGPPTFGEGGQAAPPPAPKYLHSEPRQDPPTTFETRLIGTEFDLEIAEDDWDGQDQSSVLPFVPGCQFSVHTSRQRGFHRWANVVHPDGRMSVQYYPSFESKRVSGRLALSEDDVTLVGFHADSIPAKQFQLTFLRVRRAPIPVPQK